MSWSLLYGTHDVLRFRGSNTLSFMAGFVTHHTLVGAWVLQDTSNPSRAET